MQKADGQAHGPPGALTIPVTIRHKQHSVLIEMYAEENFVPPDIVRTMSTTFRGNGNSSSGDG